MISQGLWSNSAQAQGLYSLIRRRPIGIGFVMIVVFGF